MNYNDALLIAEALLELLDHSLDFGAISGSLAREEDQIGDVDLVVVPMFGTGQDRDMFGPVGDPYPVNLLDQKIAEIVANTRHPWEVTKGTGPKIKRLRHRKSALKAQVFVADWHNLGVVLAVRTGPKEVSKLYMRAAKFRARQVSGGFYLHDHPTKVFPSGEHQPCAWADRCPEILHIPDEETFFDALGIEYLDPPNRTYEVMLESAREIRDVDQRGTPLTISQWESINAARHNY